MGTERSSTMIKYRATIVFGPTKEIDIVFNAPEGDEYDVINAQLEDQYDTMWEIDDIVKEVV